MKKKQYRNFEDARKVVHSLKLKNRKEWNEYCQAGKKPSDVPTNVDHIYKKTNEWTSWGDWLGTGRVASQNKIFLSFEDARKFVQSLNLKGQNDWKKYCASGNKPDDIPAAPWNTYKEWEGKRK